MKSTSLREIANFWRIRAARLAFPIDQQYLSMFIHLLTLRPRPLLLRPSPSSSASSPPAKPTSSPTPSSSSSTPPSSPSAATPAGANVLAGRRPPRPQRSHPPRGQPGRRRHLSRPRPARRLPHRRPPRPAPRQARPLPRPGRLRPPPRRGPDPHLLRSSRPHPAHSPARTGVWTLPSGTHPFKKNLPPSASTSPAGSPRTASRSTSPQTCATLNGSSPAASRTRASPRLELESPLRSPPTMRQAALNVTARSFGRIFERQMLFRTESVEVGSSTAPMPEDRPCPITAHLRSQPRHAGVRLIIQWRRTHSVPATVCSNQHRRIGTCRPK